MMRHTLDFGSPLPPGWTTLDDKNPYWDRFTDRFGFRLGSPSRIGRRSPNRHRRSRSTSLRPPTSRARGRVGSIRVGSSG